MRLAEFHQLVSDEFGPAKGDWIVHSHVLSNLGGTAEELLGGGVEPRLIWEGLCREFEVPAHRRLGVDRPN